MASASSPTAASSDSSPSLAELAHLCRSSSDSSASSSGPWTQSAVFEWAATLDSVLAVHGAQTEWSGLLSTSDKQAIVNYAVTSLPQQSAEHEGVGEGKHRGAATRCRRSMRCLPLPPTAGCLTEWHCHRCVRCHRPIRCSVASVAVCVEDHLTIAKPTGATVRLQSATLTHSLTHSHSLSPCRAAVKQ